MYKKNLNPQNFRQTDTRLGFSITEADSRLPILNTKTNISSSSIKRHAIFFLLTILGFFYSFQSTQFVGICTLVICLTWSHLFDSELVDEMVVVLVERAVERHAVWLEQQVLQRVHTRQPEALLDSVGQVGVVEYHVEPECLGPQCYSRPDTTCKINWRYLSDSFKSQNKLFTVYTQYIGWKGRPIGALQSDGRAYVRRIFCKNHLFIWIHREPPSSRDTQIRFFALSSIFLSWISSNSWK